MIGADGRGRRLGSGGDSHLASRIPVGTVRVYRKRALDRIYGERGIKLEVHASPDLKFQGEKQDLEVELHWSWQTASAVHGSPECVQLPTPSHVSRMSAVPSVDPSLTTMEFPPLPVPYRPVTPTPSKARSLSVGAPPEGTYYYLVGVLFENRGETVSLDALPYSVDGSALEADGESVVGVLQVDFGSAITEEIVAVSQPAAVQRRPCSDREERIDVSLDLCRSQSSSGPRLWLTIG